MRNFDEKTLVQKLDKILKKEFGTNLAFREFSAGYGIADLVFAPDFSFNKQLIQRTPLTDFNTLKVLLSLEAQEVYSFSEILTLFPQLDVTELRKQLRILTSNGYLEKIVKDNYLKAVEESNLNPIKKIIAVEVKLNDHKSGLIQARRYQYFADESYLAILKEAEKNIDFDEFNEHNIGLILFDAKTDSIEVRTPQKDNFNYEDSVSLFAKEMMLSKFLSFSS